MRDNCRGIVWLRGQGSNLDLLVQSQVWFRFHHLASGLDGEIRTPNLRLPKPARFQLRHVQVVLTAGFEPALTAV